MKSVRWFLLPLLAMAVGCGDDSDGTDGGAGGSGDVMDAGTGDGCSTDDCQDYFSVAQTLDWELQDDAGMVIGFDVDHRVSDDTDPQTCGNPDFTSPDGVEGIDSQSSLLMPLLFDATGDSIPGYVATAISDGQLLWMLGISGVDDPKDDDCVIVSSFPGVGTPFLGTDGLLAPGQTFDLDPEYGMASSECAPMKDGIVEAGPFETLLPITIVQLSEVLRIHDAHVRAELHEDGSMDVLMAGGVEIEQLFTLVRQADTAEVTEIADLLIESLADLGQDEGGVCRQLSMTLTARSTNAFVF